jgi:putative salt-induced outer membrane protein
MRRGLVLLALLLAAAPAAAREASPPEAVTVLLRKAADRDVKENTARYLDAALLVAIDGYPTHRDALLAEAQRLAPARAAALAALLRGEAAHEPVPQVSADEKSVPPGQANGAGEAPKPAGFLPVDGWKGGVELGGSLSSGNVSSESVAASINMLNDRRDWRHKAGASFALVKTDGVTSRERVTASYQLDYKVNDRLYVFGLGQYERDRFSAFRDRYLESLGVGYRALEGKTYSLDLEGSAALRQTRLDDSPAYQDELGGRLNTIFNWTVSDNFAINNTGTAFVSDLRTTLENTVAMKTKITSTLSGKLSFNVKHDTDVPFDSVRTSTETKATLLYNF